MNDISGLLRLVPSPLPLMEKSCFHLKPQPYWAPGSIRHRN